MKQLSKSILVGGLLCFAVVWVIFGMSNADAAPFPCRGHQSYPNQPEIVIEGAQAPEIGGTWFWMRSPDEEKRVIAGIFNRYCIRCHGVDGRGVWDIPGVPNFTNTRWQASRSDDQLVRIIIEGRGAVMPPFRGALSLEEAWAMARYLRNFIPGAQTPRPDLDTPEKAGEAQPKPEPKKPAPAKPEAEPKKPEVKKPVTIYGR